VVKGLSFKPWPGNPPPRIIETPCGMLNAIGLANMGLEAFLERIAPALAELTTTVIVNIYGHRIEDYSAVAEGLRGVDAVSALEINISCPNVEKGGMLFGTDPAVAAKVTEQVLKHADKPVIVKLSPNVTDIREFARACEDAGADAVSVINTLVGMSIDVEKRQPRLRFLTGGLSGPAIKPIALRMVWEACQAVKIPVIGVGGIASTEDALEFLIAGARAVQVGTANFYRPDASQRIALGLKEYCRSHNIEDINKLIGSLQAYE